jgi:hypothetical protein
MPLPTTSDLTARLTSYGVDTPSDLDLSGALAMATQEFYNRSGRGAFVGDTSTTAIRLDPPRNYNQRVRVEIPDMWALTEIRIGYSSTSAGTALTEWDDYTILPQNRTVVGKPVECIEFLTYVPWDAGNIKITGKLGYSSDCPPRAFQGILDGASMYALIQAAGTDGATAQRKQGNRLIAYQTDPMSSTVERCRKSFYEAAASFVRVHYV